LGIGDRVHLTGWVDEADKPALYSMARGALYLSEYEGFGLPALEAMASGCPLVAGGAGGRR
jgi:glycosyltransferase involved in cell wall biosynthesis